MPELLLLNVEYFNARRRCLTFDEAVMTFLSPMFSMVKLEVDSIPPLNDPK